MPRFPTLYLPADLSAPPVCHTGGRLWGGGRLGGCSQKTSSDWITVTFGWEVDDYKCSDGGNKHSWFV